LANILIIDDDQAICDLLAVMAEEMSHTSRSATMLGEGLRLLAQEAFDVVLLDLNLPDGHGLQVLPRIAGSPNRPEVIIITGEGDPDGAELAFNHGAWDFIQKPFIMKDVALPLERALQFRGQKLAQTQTRPMERQGIVGQSPALRSALDQAAQAAASSANLLITGETGTGKEIFARAIHANSQAAKGNFVVVDCSALPEALVEGILFGHRKGAFTGADSDRQGLVRQADGGTLFLDEVGELPLNAQKNFLRVLQEHRFRPVGGSEERESHFRLIAATNRHLPAMVAEGRFREDLLFRIQSITIRLPPLRERAEDIKELVFHQLSRLARQYHQDVKGFSPEFLDLLMAYAWPGNVRELFNTLDSALAAADGFPTLYPKHLPPQLRLGGVREGLRPPPAPPVPDGEDISRAAELPPLRQYRSQVVERAEGLYLRRMLELAQGDLRRACSISGLSQPRLYGLLRQHGLSPKNAPGDRG
jgi:two-component system NtrC family response regulator